ncbi:MAG TPA: hypothetical protein VF459_13230 [Caulobacteraceae bacterium]
MLAALLCVGCGKSQGARPPAAGTPAGDMANPVASDAVNPVAPPVDAAHDERPDPVKVDDFSKRLQGLEDQLAASDARLMASVRGSFQRGGQADARASVLTYSAALRSQAAVTPPLPKLTGCYGRTASALGEARDVLTREQARRGDQAQTILAVSYRPLALVDFAPLVNDASGGPATPTVQAALAKARTEATACSVAAARPKIEVTTSRPERRVAVSPTSAAASPQAVVEAPPPTAAPSSAASPAAATAPPKRRTNLLERLFGGGQHEP